MEIIYKFGDLLAGGEPYCVQGCNAQGKMGSGIAKSIRDMYPANFRAYRNKYERNGNYFDLGETVWCDVGDRIIINAITQENYGRDPDVVYASYDAIEAAVKEINNRLLDHRGLDDEPDRVAFPLIGCGLANGDWDIVSEIIEANSPDFQPVVYLYNDNGVLPIDIDPERITQD